MGRRIQIGFVLVFVILSVHDGFTQNPFDLKWRKAPGTAEPTAPALDTATIVVPSLDPADELLEDIDTTEVEAGDSAFLTLSPVVGDSSTDSSPALDIPSKEPEEEIKKESESKVISSRGNPARSQPVKVALIIVMLGLTILILTWSVNYNRGFIKQIYRAAMNENLSSLLLREQKFASSQFLYYIVYTTFFINAALFLYLIARQSRWDTGYGSTPLFYFLLFVTIIYLSKHLVMRLIGSAFEISEKTAHYNFTIILYNILAGIALIPVNLLLAFGSDTLAMPVVYIGLIILGLLYLLRQFRGLVIASDALAGNGFQFFIYLCAIEILPVLVLFKFFTTH